MADRIIRVNVTMPYITGLPRDVSINTFHFMWEDTNDLDATLVDALSGFYNDVWGSATKPISDYMSRYFDNATDHSGITVYDAQAEGGPIGGDTWTLAQGDDQDTLPFEVSVALSYIGDGSGVPLKRRRGRIYVGPINLGAANLTSNGPGSPSTGFEQSLVGAATELANNAALAAVGLRWAVYSRVNDAAYPITQGWVDNEFDTQRRRQVRATSRETWTAPALP